MINFWFYKYKLQPVVALNARTFAKERSGALFKVQWPDQKIGFADCHPWPEFGEADIDTQLESFAHGQISNVMEQTIWLAHQDALARSQNRNMFQNTTKVKNHYLVDDVAKLNSNLSDRLKVQGFTTIKIKAGHHLEEEAKAISKFIKMSQFNIRLDLNARADFASFEKFMSYFGSEKSRIEFIEDPMPFEVGAWQEAAKMVPLAMDWESERVDWENAKDQPFKFIILKPARNDVKKNILRAQKYNLKVAVTSSMDHPLGVVHAAAQASEIKKNHPHLLVDCGCLTFSVYQPNMFTSQIEVQGPYLMSTVGKGIGFDHILMGLAWEQLQK